MQNVFAEATPWHTPWMKRVLPCVAAIAERHSEQTIFTRFIPPPNPEEAIGSWRRYFDRWREMTTGAIDPWLLDLVDPLGNFVPPARILDKPTYSPFHRTGLAAQLIEEKCDTLIITGAETDMCVLAAVLDAIDLGMRVVLPTDAVCSSSDATHDALMTLYNARFSQQIETTDTDTVLTAWS